GLFGKHVPNSIFSARNLPAFFRRVIPSKYRGIKSEAQAEAVAETMKSMGIDPRAAIPQSVARFLKPKIKCGPDQPSGPHCLWMSRSHPRRPKAVRHPRNRVRRGTLVSRCALQVTTGRCESVSRDPQ